MTTEYCQLTINISSRILTEVMSHFLMIPQWVQGCSAVKASGFGPQQHYGTASERVKGATERSLILIILRHEHLRDVLTHIQNQFHRADLYYWTIPVLDQGRLAVEQPK